MNEHRKIKIKQLLAHPLNSNVMPEDRFDKLKSHIAKTGNYPPIIVRQKHDQEESSLRDIQEQVYEILDGHHRVKALHALDRQFANCVVWNVNDEEALTLLATLNRLSGEDDVKKRAKLIHKLSLKLNSSSDEKLSNLLPENRKQIEKLLALAEERVNVKLPKTQNEMPVVVHFFLNANDKRKLESRLREIAGENGTREEALMQLVRA